MRAEPTDLDEGATAPLHPPAFDPGDLPGTATFAVVIPRRAVNPRGTVRAAEVWRMAQEAAVQGSAAAGWPPDRFRREGSAFVVSEMTVNHLRELPYGCRVVSRTWISELRRRTLATREVRLWTLDGPFATITQRWAHVSWGGPDQLAVCPAPDALQAAWGPVSTPSPSARLPEPVGPRRAALAPFALEVWHTWMDPLGHVNHPAYVDFLDEALARAAAAAGLDPQALVPVAERLRFRQAANAGDLLQVDLQVVGDAEAGGAHLEGRIWRPADGAELVRATLVRGLVGGGGGALGAALAGGAQAVR